MKNQNLTDFALKALKAESKIYKVNDGTIPGLFVAVSPTGKKVFRLAYTFAGKATQITLCSYPEFTLREARELAIDARRQLAKGINPNAERKAKKAKEQAALITFRDVAAKWFKLREPRWSLVHQDDTHKILELHILPSLGDIAMCQVGKAEIKLILDSLQTQNKLATLKKVRSIISQIFRHAIDHEIAGVQMDWTTQLQRQYATSIPRHRAALVTPTEARSLMSAIESYANTNMLTCLALKLSALTFCRPGEIRQAEWNEIDFESALWRIPAHKMKMRQPHTVPLARQTLQVLEQLRPISVHRSKYLFPSMRSADRPMSEATVTAALRRMGYGKEQMCAHGFRGMASTLLNEMGYNSDWIELQLAHEARNSVRSAYNHAKFLDNRKKMMQDWADFLMEDREF